MRSTAPCTADDLIDVIERLVAERGAPPSICAWTTGPNSIAWALRDWCRLSRHQDPLHRARLALGERLRRVVQRPVPRRAAQHRGVRRPLPKPGSLSKPGGWSTTPGGPTRPLGDSPRPSSPSTGPSNTNQPSRNSWTRLPGTPSAKPACRQEIAVAHPAPASSAIIASPTEWARLAREAASHRKRFRYQIAAQSALGCRSSAAQLDARASIDLTSTRMSLVSSS